MGSGSDPEYFFHNIEYPHCFSWLSHIWQASRYNTALFPSPVTNIMFRNSLNAVHPLFLSNHLLSQLPPDDGGGVFGTKYKSNDWVPHLHSWIQRCKVPQFISSAWIGPCPMEHIPMCMDFSFLARDYYSHSDAFTRSYGSSVDRQSGLDL